MKYWFLGLFCFLELGCVYDPPTATLEVFNYSDSAIYVAENCECNLTALPILRLFETRDDGATDVKGQAFPEIYSPNYRINPYQIGNIGYFGTPKNREVQCENGVICLFFIKEITMRNYSWDEIVEKKLYNKKLSFNKEQLDSLDWKIKYEP
ncbi:hypothetical protein [Pedobacter glucosidilyticus]|uniref:hypothetical protein n=1 Tax=Pedobacter glucosidilyticus TaxID=1122941 RepID=UPI0026F34AEA|nr:hypothetical protein [Pedobacter glucosidilyticus]